MPRHFTLAPAVRAALREATTRWPDRDKSADGTIGDAAHATRRSDHNMDERGVVLAFDLTCDVDNGCDSHALVRAAVERRDPRIKYAISNRRIWSKARAAEGWRPYSGSNPHTKHAHVSVDRRFETDTSPWWPMPDLPEETDVPLSDEDVKRIAAAVVSPANVDRIANRVLEVVANGKNRYGLDNLYRLHVQTLGLLADVPAPPQPEVPPQPPAPDAPQT